MDTMELSSTALSGEEEVVCYSCQEYKTDVLGHSPRRACACRGSDAGYVHLFFLAKYATDKSRQEQYLDEFKRPWESCLVCKQNHRGEFAINIANEFSSFVQRDIHAMQYCK